MLYICRRRSRAVILPAFPSRLRNVSVMAQASEILAGQLRDRFPTSTYRVSIGPTRGCNRLAQDTPAVGETLLPQLPSTKQRAGWSGADPGRSRQRRGSVGRSYCSDNFGQALLCRTDAALRINTITPISIGPVLFALSSRPRAVDSFLSIVCLRSPHTRCKRSRGARGLRALSCDSSPRGATARLTRHMPRRSRTSASTATPRFFSKGSPASRERECPTAWSPAQSLPASSDQVGNRGGVALKLNTDVERHPRFHAQQAIDYGKHSSPRVSMAWVESSERCI